MSHAEANLSTLKGDSIAGSTDICDIVSSTKCVFLSRLSSNAHTSEAGFVNDPLTEELSEP